MNPRATRRILLTVLGMGLSVQAQVFKLQGGSSSLFRADGGSVEIRGTRFDSALGAGFMNGRFGVGAVTHTKYRDYTLAVGDDSIVFQLPTDVFDSSHYFLGRGIGVQRSYEKNSFRAFLGATSSTFGTPFFLTAKADKPLGVLFFQRQLTQKLRFVSRNAASSRQTSIQGFEHQPNAWLKTSVAAGIGSNQGYFATGLAAEKERFSLRTAYISAGTNFQRIRLSMPQSSELEKENITFTYHPSKYFSTTASHQHILQPESSGALPTRASVDEFFSNFNIAHLSFGGGVVDSRIKTNSTLGLAFYTSRRITNRIDLTGNFFQSRPNNATPSNTITGTLRETLTNRLSLSQLIVRSNGQTTAGFGGEFASNWFSARLDYQTVYVPLRLDKPFQQALSLNARAQISSTLAISAASYVAPDGRVRYTFSFTNYLYRYKGLGGGGPVERYSFPKCVVQGMVLDESNAPIEGAALHINGEVAYSDASGNFMVRLSKRGPHTFKVALDEFITAGTFEVISAPAKVVASPEDHPVELKVVLRRVRPQSTITSPGIPSR
jgi:hypothetical protein